MQNITCGQPVSIFLWRIDSVREVVPVLTGHSFCLVIIGSGGRFPKRGSDVSIGQTVWRQEEDVS